MTLNLFEITTFVEDKRLAFDDGQQLLKDFIGGEIDLIDEHPVALLNRFDEVAFHEVECEVRFDLILVCL